MNTEPHDNIVKAQALYRQLVQARTPQDFKQIFGNAIHRHSLDEFYLVVVRAEHSAALALCDNAIHDNPNLSVAEWLDGFCGIKPGHLIGTRLDTVADIAGKDILAVADLARRLSFDIKDNVITGHAQAVRPRAAGKKVTQHAAV